MLTDYRRLYVILFGTEINKMHFFLFKISLIFKIFKYKLGESEVSAYFLTKAMKYYDSKALYTRQD